MKIMAYPKINPPECILENNKFSWTPSNVALSQNISLQKVYKLFRGEGGHNDAGQKKTIS